MRNPLKDIEKAKGFVTEIKQNLGYIKSPKRRAFETDMVKCFESLINSFESMIEYKYKLESVEGLLVGRFYSMCLQKAVKGEKMCLKQIIREIDHDINFSKQRKQELINFLFVESAVMDIEKNKKITKQDYWRKFVDDLFREFKMQMIWTSSQKSL